MVAHGDGAAARMAAAAQLVVEELLPVLRYACPALSTVATARLMALDGRQAALGVLPA